MKKNHTSKIITAFVLSLTIMSVLSGCGATDTNKKNQEARTNPTPTPIPPKKITSCEQNLPNINGEKTNLNFLLNNKSGKFVLKEFHVFTNVNSPNVKASYGGSAFNDIIKNELRAESCLITENDVSYATDTKFYLPESFISGSGKIISTSLFTLSVRGNLFEKINYNEHYDIKDFIRYYNVNNSNWIKHENNLYSYVSYIKNSETVSKSIITYEFIPMNEDPKPQPTPSPTPIPTPSPIPTPTPSPKPTEDQVLNRCSLKNNYITIDGNDAFLFYSDSVRRNYYSKLIQSGACTKKSRISVKNNYITIDGNDAFLFYNETSRITAFMRLLALDQASFYRCGIKDNYITLDGNKAFLFYNNEVRLNEFEIMVKNKECQ